jgi:hypothetical protein
MGTQQPRDGKSDRVAARRPQTRKAYSAPRLTEYGDLRKITMAGKGGNKGDGGGQPATKR